MTEEEMIEVKHGSENMCDLLNQEQTELKTAMIEEMAGILGYSCGSKSMDDCNEFDDCDECRATDFYNAGYRKIPEGAVVLTEEQMDMLVSRAYYEDQVKKARKETAREIFSEVLDLEGLTLIRDMGWEKTYETIYNEMIEIAKRFGVEVE